MPQTNIELLKEALEDTDELTDYVLSSSGDPNLPKWIQDLKAKIAVVYGRLLEKEET